MVLLFLAERWGKWDLLPPYLFIISVKGLYARSVEASGDINGVEWFKSNVGRYKCNIDASFFKQINKFGIVICIRNETNNFVLAKTKVFEPIYMLVKF